MPPTLVYIRRVLHYSFFAYLVVVYSRCPLNQKELKHSPVFCVGSNTSLAFKLNWCVLKARRHPELRRREVLGERRERAGGRAHVPAGFAQPCSQLSLRSNAAASGPASDHAPTAVDTGPCRLLQV